MIGARNETPPRFPPSLVPPDIVYHREDKSGFVIERNARESFLFCSNLTIYLQPPNPCRPAWRMLRTGVNGARTTTQQQQQQQPRSKTIYDLLHSAELSLSPLLPTLLPSTCFYPSRFTGFRN